MKVSETIKELKITLYQYYSMRQAGIIPGPKMGIGLRKKYSPLQIKEIKQLLKEMEN